MVDEVLQLGHEVPRRAGDYANGGSYLPVGTGLEIAFLCSQGISSCVFFLTVWEISKLWWDGGGSGCQTCSARGLS